MLSDVDVGVPCPEPWRGMLRECRNMSGGNTPLSMGVWLPERCVEELHVQSALGTRGASVDAASVYGGSDVKSGRQRHCGRIS